MRALIIYLAVILGALTYPVYLAFTGMYARLRDTVKSVKSMCARVDKVGLGLAAVFFACCAGFGFVVGVLTFLIVDSGVLA